MLAQGWRGWRRLPPGSGAAAASCRMLRWERMQGPLPARAQVLALEQLIGFQGLAAAAASFQMLQAQKMLRTWHLDNPCTRPVSPSSRNRDALPPRLKSCSDLVQNELPACLILGHGIKMDSREIGRGLGRCKGWEWGAMPADGAVAGEYAGPGAGAGVGAVL